MKNFRISVHLIAVAAVFLLQCLSMSDSLSAAQSLAAKSPEVLKSASELHYPPFAIVGPDGKADGFSVELLREVCKSVGLQVAFSVGPWNEIKQQLAEGKLDVLPFVSYSKERDENFDFSVPYLRMHGTIFVRQSNNAIKTEADLQGKEVLVMRGDTAHEYALKKHLTDKLILTNDYQEAFGLLSQGKHDAILVQQLVGWQLLRKLGISNLKDVGSGVETTLKPQAKSLAGFEQKFCIAVHEGNTDLLAQLNEGLAIIIANGTYDTLYDKWLISILPRSAPSLSQIVRYLLAIILPLLFLLTVGVVYFLKREIKKKTATMTREAQKRKRIQHDLEETKERYRILFETVIDPVLVADTQTGVIVECNQIAESFFGKTRNELIGIHQAELVQHNRTESDTSEMSPEFKMQCADPDLTVEAHLRCADNKIRLVSVQVTKFRHDEQDLIMSVFRDVTEHRRMMAALNKSEKLLRKAQSIAHLGHWELDVEKNKLLWSDEVYHIFGIAPGQAEITYQIFLEGIHPEDRQAVDTAYTSSVRNGKDGYEISHRIVRKNDGAVSHVQEKCEHIKDANGTIIRSIGTIQDTTAYNTVEMNLREALSNAEAANRSRSIFLANMSHEIRTPLNGIIGMLQLLSHDSLLPPQLEYVTHALNSGKRLTSLLSDILDLSKVDAGILTIRSEPFDLKDVLDSISQLFTPAVKQKKLDFTIALFPPDMPTKLEGDPLRLQQILSNIVGNAVKFTESGSIELEVFPLPAPDPMHCKLLFSISDEGIGIPADQWDNLFGAFTQVESSYTRNFQGAGLGLAISKNLVSLMGGDIDVASRLGAGTCFQFCISFPIAASIPEQTAYQIGACATSPCRILLAEDDHVSRLAAAKLLKNLGQSVRIVENGEQALAALQEETFDVVLMDIQMPVMEGLEATKAIRAGKAGEDIKNIPIIAMTAYAMNGDKENFLEAGMNDYISKPIDQSMLDQVLARVTRRWASP